jgi:hypothetical protein
LPDHPWFAAKEVRTAGDLQEERIGSFRILDADERAVAATAMSEGAEK